MNDDPRERADGIQIDGLTDDAISRLPEPYDIMAEMTRYIPLDVLLAKNLLAPYAAYDPDPTTVSVLLAWDQNYRIPRSLFDRLIRYQKKIEPLRDEMVGGRQRNAMFTALDHAVTEASFFEVVRQAFSR